jgi:epoxyqueuosine reductase
MDYLEKHLKYKKNPKNLNPAFESCLVLSFKYIPLKQKIFSFLKIAKYANQKDYHFLLRNYLQQLAVFLKEHYKNDEFTPFVDSGPILERDLAYQAGLGWIGKNTLLIHPKHGSFTFLASVFSSQAVQRSTQDLPKQLPDFCGNCTRCIDSCPTQALEVRSLDANKCIAYWTIESRKVATKELRKKFDSWFFGCDICQEVCPWNQRFAQETDLPDFQPYPWNISPLLSELADLSPTDWEDRFPASALRRIKPEMLRRNARANLE